MTLSHLFVIDPLASLNKALDSSLRLMFELDRLGHHIFTCEPRHLSWKLGEPSAQARVSRICFKESPEQFWTEQPGTRELGGFAAIHMRKDPPYDLDYIATTWLLDAAKISNQDGKAGKSATRLYNDPAALRTYNEKLAFFHFGIPGTDIKPALVSSDPEEIMQFIETQANGDAVLKPLTLFGGRGVEHIDLKKVPGGRAAALELIRQETANGTSSRLVQAFDPAIYAGEVRAFTAFGEPIAWCLKKPAAGNFLANTRAGATLLPYTPTASEVERIRRLSAALLAKGVAFIGYDLIGGYVSEINITSPRLLVGPGDGRNYYQQMAALVERDIRS